MAENRPEEPSAPHKSRLILRKIILATCGVAGILLLAEILLQLGVGTHVLPYYYPLENAYYSYNPVPYFSKPCCIRDSISGFRWINKGAIALKVCHGKIIFNQVIKPNNAGFISPSGFEPRKTDSTVFRWLVFGDSFTDGYFLTKNWPSALSEMLVAQNKSIELHSFALNGSGITAWSRLLDWLNKMHYEYDGIIIACFGNDLSRDQFVMYHTTDSCYYGWSNISDEGGNSALKAEPLIINRDIDQNVSGILAGQYGLHQWRLLLPYYFRILRKEIKQNLWLRFDSKDLFNKYIFAGRGAKTDSAQMIDKYGQEKITLTEKMLTSCNEQNKKILLASIPDLKGSEIGRTGDDIQLNRELHWLASKHNAVFFDGYGIFGNQSAGLFFLEYDGHWNQDGSNLFATKLLPVIINASKKRGG